MSTRRVQFLVVLLAVLLEVQAGIQQWFVQNVLMTEHQRDEEAPDPAIGVEKRMKGFELHLGKGRFDHRIHRLMQVLLEIGKTRLQMRGWRCHERCVSGTRAPDPLLGVTEFAGLLLCAPPIGKQEAMHSA